MYSQLLSGFYAVYTKSFSQPKLKILDHILRNTKTQATLPPNKKERDEPRPFQLQNNFLAVFHLGFERLDELGVTLGLFELFQESTGTLFFI